MTIRLHLRRWQFKFLGLFREVRALRLMEARGGEILRLRNAEILEGKGALKSQEIEYSMLYAKSEETTRGLAIMTESRLNADRQIELLRGILQGNSEIAAREVAGMKQTVDCFALQVLGRQVYGTAPLAVRVKEPETETARGIPVREAQRQGTQEFFEEAIRRSKMEPPPQPEYSSKNAVNGSANVA